MAAQFWEYNAIGQRPVWLKMILPLLLSAAAIWLTVEPLAMVGYSSPFLLCFAAIFLSAAYGGCWAALLATVAATIGAIVFILPRHSQAPVFYFSIMLFLLEGLLLTLLFRLIEDFQIRLKTNEARFRGMIEQSAEGFLLADANGIITYSAPVSTELLGYTADELVGLDLQTLVNPEEIRSFEFRFLMLRNNYGNTIHFLQRLKTKNDGWKWIEGSARNLLKDDNIKSLVINYRNVNERIDKNKQQEDFVHMASHELKTPITALKGFSQLIRLNHDKEGRDKDNHLLNRIEQQLNKLLGLIDDMLDITRIKAGELRYYFEWFDFGACVADVVEATQTTTTHQLMLTTVPCPLIYGDKDKISQVINNLVSNAIKYSPGKTSVELRIGKDETCVYLYVRDYGIGIPKSKQKKVFERFYRVDELHKTSFAGLGLGLYIAMEIIRKHRGKIGVESEEGNGAEFWFGLPINSVDPAQ